MVHIKLSIWLPSKFVRRPSNYIPLERHLVTTSLVDGSPSISVRSAQSVLQSIASQTRDFSYFGRGPVSSTVNFFLKYQHPAVTIYQPITRLKADLSDLGWLVIYVHLRGVWDTKINVWPCWSDDVLSRPLLKWSHRRLGAKVSYLPLWRVSDRIL